MSEFTVMSQEVKKGIHVSLADAVMIIAGIMAGLCCMHYQACLLSFCVMGYFFQKSLIQFVEFVISFFLFACITNTICFYQSCLLFLFFCLLILFVRVIHASLFHWMPWILSGTGFLMVLVYSSNVELSMKAAVFSFMLMKLCSNEKILVQKDWIISEMMFSVLVSIGLIWSSSFLSDQQILIANALFMCSAALRFEASSSIGLLFLLCVLGNFQHVLLCWILPAVSLIWLKQNKVTAFLIYPVLCALVQGSQCFFAALFVISVALALPSQEKLIFLDQEHEDDLMKIRLRNAQNQLHHHLLQFSQLFDLIADYYDGSFHKETEFLRGMSASMSTLSLKMKQCALSQEDEAWKISELLKGYHYDIIKTYVSYSDDGSIQIRVVINECVLKDVEDVILPLLQMNVDQSLKLVSCRKANRLTGSMQIELAGKTPYRMKAKTYRVVNEEKISGDTCSVFHDRNHIICTISDGMGVGKKAQDASRFVTEAAQRLHSCGMPIENIVKCINSLCTLSSSEHFATLDFMCFDALNHQVVMAKNGAAPSYLIRGKQIIKIEGHSLPLGIVHQICTDCYQVEVKRHDLIIMCSDGCTESMIQNWLRSTNLNELKNHVEYSLSECEKRDDMSVIVAEVL